MLFVFEVLAYRPAVCFLTVGSLTEAVFRVEAILPLIGLVASWNFDRLDSIVPVSFVEFCVSDVGHGAVIIDLDPQLLSLAVRFFEVGRVVETSF